MSQFLHILTHVILPIFLMTSSGYLLQKRLNLDFTAFSRMLFYLVLPSLVFTRLSRTKLSVADFGVILGFMLGLVAIMGLLSVVVSRIRGHKPSMRNAFGLSTMLYNSGNYGISVVELVFHANPFATAIQVIVFTTQSLITFTMGVMLAAHGQMPMRESIRTVLRYPMVYAIVLAFIFRGYNLPVWQPVWVCLETMSMALIPMALVLLGAQLADTRLTQGLMDVFISSGIRLALSPIIVFAFIQVFQIHGILAQTLLIASSMPTAVNSALLALEFQNEPEFASQAVFFSTLFSVLTVSATIYVATVWLG